MKSLETTMGDIARFFEVQINDYEMRRRAEEAARKIVAQRDQPEEEDADDEPR